ncbi:MAG: Na+/H+ antiporter NhaA [Alphaproteobacteria bacterium]|nr:Na+/H+ antiporter NhaA [Alphaproteobacteria bacterium]
MQISMIRDFLKLEAAGGILLIIASVLALLFANSPAGSLYVSFLDIPVAIKFGALEIAKPLLLWINDGLMAVFFFLVGLEIKREFLEGELSSGAQLLLPAAGAVGGMIIPAGIYAFLNWDSPENLNGWAIPAATDIAFALGVLALVGSRVPLSLKVLLTAIAILDDLGAIIIIAMFYTSELSAAALMSGLVAIAGLIVINRLRVLRLAPYLLLGIILWICILKSGVHATLAGVITALAIPMRPRNGHGESLLTHLEHMLHPWVAFAILPIFAFANAGVSFEGIGIQSFIEPVKLGISLGLFAGKQIGIFLVLLLCIKVAKAPMPPGTNWTQLYGMSVLCGIGFTMSLFIGSLAFEHSDFDAPIRLGVLTGSIASALVGYFLLRISTESARQPVAND